MVRDAYFGLGHTDLIGQLDNVQNFINKWNYPGLTSNLESEYCAIANVRFLLSPVASITPNASLLGANVYNTFITGREAFAAVEQSNYSSNFLYRAPIFNDPLCQNASVGWKSAMAFKILNSSWVFNLRSTLTT
jgi:N4-gp56 family major capsid protein